MATYFDCLSAVEAALRADVRFGGARVALRPEPSFVPPLDAFPQLVVAPRADLAETVIQQQSETWDLGYTVYVGAFFLKEWATRDLERRLEWREWIRELFKRPKSLAMAVPGIWNTLYDPRPAVPGEPPANAVGSWQQFTFVGVRNKGFSSV